MKLYHIAFGGQEFYIAAENEEHAREVGSDAEAFPGIHYLPFEIREITVEGYNITLAKDAQKGDKERERVSKMNRDQLKAYMMKNQIEFTPQWGEEKLREAALTALEG